MKLSVIMPVYNEEGTVRKSLVRLLRIKNIHEVIVVNDGSTDNSFEQIKKIENKKLKAFSKENGGKGSAVRYGLKKVTGDYVLIQDADLECDPRDIPKLIRAIKENKVDVVYGSRFMKTNLDLMFWYHMGNIFLNLMINILFGTHLSDMESCYKLMPTKIWKKIKFKADRFDMEPEITCKLIKEGYEIMEVPISYVGRTVEDGKKIGFKDGIEAALMILKERFNF